MVKNREELLQVAQSNANQLKGHLRKAIGDFLNAQGVSPDELAYVLGISNEEMHQILDGDGNITVNTLSKLLVATDMAVEIKPVVMTPLKGYGRNMPRSGAFPGGPVPPRHDGRPIAPPPFGWPRPEEFFGAPEELLGQRPGQSEHMEEVPMETCGQPRDARGRFAKKPRNVSKPTPIKRERMHQENPNPYFELGNSELANIIRQNIWDGEIDVNNATHAQLANFVAEKERIMRERTNGNGQTHTCTDECHKVKGGGDTLKKFTNMLGNMIKEAEHNPALMDAISRFMPTED